MAALIEAADVYVGYDSAGQHVAAAVGTPGVTAFVVEAGERHLRRWSAAGRGPTVVSGSSRARPTWTAWSRASRRGRPTC